MTNKTSKVTPPVKRYIHGGYFYDALGNPVNLATIAAFNHMYNLTNETFNNGASRLSKRVRGIATQTYYIGLSIPEGRELIIFNRDLELSEGDYDIDVVIPSGGFTGGTEAIKSALAAGQESTVTSSLKMGVTPSGALTVADEGMLDTGVSIGSGNAGGASAVEGVTLSIRGQSMLRVQKVASADPFNARIRLICWERDIE